MFARLLSKAHKSSIQIFNFADLADDCEMDAHFIVTSVVRYAIKLSNWKKPLQKIRFKAFVINLDKKPVWKKIIIS